MPRIKVVLPHDNPVKITLKLKFYGKGVYKTASGHLRYSTPKEMKGKYVHRHKVDQMIAETPYSLRLLIPFPFEVHHMDYNKENNCGCNFLLLPEAFHAMLTAAGRNRDGGRFGRKFIPKWKLPPPQWELPLYEDGEIPF